MSGVRMPMICRPRLPMERERGGGGGLTVELPADVIQNTIFDSTYLHDIVCVLLEVHSCLHHY